MTGNLGEGGATKGKGEVNQARSAGRQDKVLISGVRGVTRRKGEGEGNRRLEGW